MDPVTENPGVGDTEVWEFYNTTADAHPMHIHEVAFEVVNREGLLLDERGEVVQPIQLDGDITPPEPWETGVKDTVVALPGQVTRVRAHFDNPRPVRVALPHRRARGQRDDAALPHRPRTARPTRMTHIGDARRERDGPNPPPPRVGPSRICRDQTARWR